MQDLSFPKHALKNKRAFSISALDGIMKLPIIKQTSCGELKEGNVQKLIEIEQFRLP